MATIGSELISDLRHTNDFLNQQRNILSEKGFKETLAGQTKMFETRLLKSQGMIGTEHARQLSELLSGGPWDADMKERLGSALNKALLPKEGAVHGASGSPRRANQECLCFTKYLTAKELEVLASDCHHSTKVETLMMRMEKIGLHLATERTYASIVGSAAQLGIKLGANLTGEQLLQDLKSRLRSYLKHRPRLDASLFLIKYPDTPDELPDALWQRAYSKDDQPEGRDVHAEYVRMRKRRDAAQQTMMATGSGAGVSTGREGGVSPMEVLMQFMQTMMAQQNGGGINLQMNLPRKRQKALEDTSAENKPLALEDKKDDPQEKDDQKQGKDEKKAEKKEENKVNLFDLDVTAGKPADATEHMENTSNAMQKRAEAKEAEKIGKPKAKAKGKAKAKSAATKAKAKAVAKVIAKRPAGKSDPPGGGHDDADDGDLKLGCMKCRGARNGCIQCRRSSYTGRRVTRAEWVRISNSEGYK